MSAFVTRTQHDKLGAISEHCQTRLAAASKIADLERLDCEWKRTGFNTGTRNLLSVLRIKRQLPVSATDHHQCVSSRNRQIQFLVFVELSKRKTRCLRGQCEYLRLCCQSSFRSFEHQSLCATGRHHRSGNIRETISTIDLPDHQRTQCSR